MAVRTLLQIINTAQQELGLPQSSSVIGNATDATAMQMLGFAQSEIEELAKAKENGWTALTFEYNLVVSPPVETTGDVTENSAVITNIPDTSGISARSFYVQGPSIPQGARVLSVDSATQITMTMESTGTSVGGDLVFARDTYPEPDNFNFFISDTWWDRTNRWQLLGPSSPQEDQWHLSGIVATGPRRYFRQIGPYSNNYRIWPPPAEIVEPLQLVFEYIANTPIRENTTTGVNNFIQYWADDANVPLLDDRAIIMGIKWRFWEQKGLNWLSKRKEYDDYVARLMSRDGGNTKLSLVNRPPAIYITPQNVQDGYFPGPSGPNMS
jgi:hypothetical protein